MRQRLAILLLLGAAACSGQSGGANQTATGTPTAAAGTTMLQPGRWEITRRVVSMEMPNAPPEVSAQLRSQPAQPPEVAYDCITPQQAANPIEDIRQTLIHEQPNLSCTPTTQIFGNGRIRLGLDCRGLNGEADQRLAMVGTYTATTLRAAVSTRTATAMAGAMQLVQAENTMIGRRVGECNGTETE